MERKENASVDRYEDAVARVDRLDRAILQLDAACEIFEDDAGLIGDEYDPQNVFVVDDDDDDDDDDEAEFDEG